jgi:hypothetical protein
MMVASGSRNGIEIASTYDTKTTAPSPISHLISLRVYLYFYFVCPPPVQFGSGQLILTSHICICILDSVDGLPTLHCYWNWSIVYSCIVPLYKMYIVHLLRFPHNYMFRWIKERYWLITGC